MMEDGWKIEDGGGRRRTLKERRSSSSYARGAAGSDGAPPPDPWSRAISGERQGNSSSSIARGSRIA